MLVLNVFFLLEIIVIKYIIMHYIIEKEYGDGGYVLLECRV